MGEYIKDLGTALGIASETGAALPDVTAGLEAAGDLVAEVEGDTGAEAG